MLAALEARNDAAAAATGPVVVTVMDRDRMADYQAMASELRDAGIRAEVYLGNPKNFGNQLKYADKRGAPVAIIQGALGGISLAIAGVQGAVFWGALMAVMSVIPGIGTFVVWGPIVVYLFIRGDTVTAMALLAWNIRPLTESCNMAGIFMPPNTYPLGRAQFA